ncbi:galactose-specific lectin nattectin [Astyanax mexicanus]|uniref:galactose-specific lectin nattectin n=1 Tax=Astyanax mexicanus TaxID=7994 RepID=UPI000440BCF9|nr:galactose-specific lectin nattectin [Astyanax mexicanus]
MAILTVALLLGLLLATDGVCKTAAQKYFPSEWSAYGIRKFKFFETKLTWADAEAECLKHGGNLASIHGSEENAFILNLIKKGAGSILRTWIGGHDTVKEGRWFWSDGSKMNFQNWGKNEPNNHLLGEDCLEIIYGDDLKWNDIPCSSTRSFVCART